MKKLLILAGAAVHCKVVRKAKEMGIYTIVTDYLTHSPAKAIADESWMLSITDVDGIVEKCKEAGVDGVLNYCIDPGQKPYQQICERLGLPCIGTKEQFDIMTDKRKFKDYCIEHNVDVIEDYTSEQIKEGSVKYPLFIKPAINRGSRGQQICRNYEEAIKSYDKAALISGNGNVLCERCMCGNQDIAAAFFVVNGEPYLIKFGDRIPGREEDNLNRQVMCTLLPSVFSSLFEAKVYGKVKNMIKELGIKFGPVFMQGFVDEETVRFYDPGLRMPGSDYDLMLYNATGFDAVKSMVHFAMTGDTKTVYGEPGNSYLLGNKKALLFTVSVKPGRIEKIEGYEAILQHPDTVYGFTQLSEGDIVPASGDIGQRVAEFGILLPDKEMAEECAHQFYDTFKVLDESGHNMILSRIIDKENIKELLK